MGRWPARRLADPPGDLHVRLLGRDREPTVLQLSGAARVARWLEVAQFVLEGRLARPCRGGPPARGLAAAVPPPPTAASTVRGRRWLGQIFPSIPCLPA